MATADSRLKLVVIVGPTATGKSDLAMMIARAFGGEIIAADSRTVYKDMNIGTAKPEPEDRSEIPHHGLDLIEPGQSFSAHQFKKYAQAKIKEIQKRGKLPILVGGTGLYIDGVLFDIDFVDSPAPGLRQTLEGKSTRELQAIISKEGYSMPENSQNKRHLIRTIERQGRKGNFRSKPMSGSLLIGLMPGDEIIKDRIGKRASVNLSAIITETKELLAKYGEKKLLKTAGIPYLTALKYIKGEISEQEALQRLKTAEWQYARRQKVWFKRNKYINWFESADKAFSAFKQDMVFTVGERTRRQRRAD